MRKISFDIPALYGDHHVCEVRRILLGIPGVKDVYASSAFQVVEVRFTEKKVDEQEIQKKLEDAGYLGAWTFPTESGVVVGTIYNNEKGKRHTEVYEQVKSVVSFSQSIGYQGRPLWPCPGIGIIKGTDQE